MRTASHGSRRMRYLQQAAPERRSQVISQGIALQDRNHHSNCVESLIRSGLADVGALRQNQ